MRTLSVSSLSNQPFRTEGQWTRTYLANKYHHVLSFAFLSMHIWRIKRFGAAGPVKNKLCATKTLLDIWVIDQCPVQHFPPVSAHVSMCIFVSYRRVSRLVRTWSRVKGSAVGCFTSTVSVRHSNPTRSCCVRSAAQVSCYLSKKWPFLCTRSLLDCDTMSTIWHMIVIFVLW